MLLRLQPYDCIIKYLTGRGMVTADALSPLFTDEFMDEFEVPDINVKIHLLIRITPSCILHGGHLGMEKCKLRAKSCVFWPGLYKEIESLVNSCCVCQKYYSSQQKEPMIPSEIHSRPLQTVSADLFYVQRAWFLVVADYYSKFPFVKKPHNHTPRALVMK